MELAMSQTATKEAGEKFCHECGVAINVKAEICPKCGVRQSTTANTINAIAPNGKSKLAAALFALFLGGIGIHKFYLGRIGWGIVYLLLCWTFIPALVGFIEGIILLIMNDADFNKKYGVS